MKFIKVMLLQTLLLSLLILSVGYQRSRPKWNGFLDSVDRLHNSYVGDGLVSQIPALLIAISAGLS